MPFTAHYSLIMALFWANYAVVLNYASVYLLGKGFQNTEIGILTAAAALLSAAAQPLIGSYADRPRSPSVRTILLAVIGLFLVFCLLIPFSAVRSHALLFAVYTLAMMTLQSMMSLMNSLGTMTARAGGKVNFGVARGIGSLAYAVVSLLIGSAVTRYGIDLIPWAGAGIYALLAVSVRLYPFEKQPVPPVQNRQAGFLKRYPAFALILFAAVFLYSSHSMIASFMFQIICAKGGDSESFGIVMAIAAVLELPVMFAFTRLLRRISAGRWLVISGFAFVLKSAGTLLVASVPGLYAVQVTQTFSYAVITVASVYFTDRLMEPQDAVKGQALFAMTGTAGSVLGAGVGGWLIDFGGVHALLAVSVAFALAGAVMMTFGVHRQKPLPAQV